jgi:hypothetical protein
VGGQQRRSGCYGEEKSHSPLHEIEQPLPCPRGLSIKSSVHLKKISTHSESWWVFCASTSRIQTGSVAGCVTLLHLITVCREYRNVEPQSTSPAEKSTDFQPTILCRIWRVLPMVCSTQNHWVSGLFLSTGILTNSKAWCFGNSICFRPQVREKTATLLGSVIEARARISFPSLQDANRSRYPDIQWLSGLQILHNHREIFTNWLDIFPGCGTQESNTTTE